MSRTANSSLALLQCSNVGLQNVVCFRVNPFFYILTMDMKC